MKSRSAIMTAPGQPLTIDEIDVPEPGPNQVIVKQTASGICASQIHELNLDSLERIVPACSVTKASAWSPMWGRTSPT